MRRKDKQIWTYLIVTAVTVLIWFLAAGETRDQRAISVGITFEVDAPTPWIVEPARHTLTIHAEGSRLALDRADEVARGGLTIDLPPIRGQRGIGLLELLRRNDTLAQTGVFITAVEPSTVPIERDEIVSVSARVRALLPGVQTEGSVTIDPSEVTISMPSALAERAVGEITVEAFLDRAVLERLPPDVRHETQANLRLGEALLGLTSPAGPAANTTISPSTVTLGFTIRSRMRQTTLDLVRVRLSGPPEDNREYVVDLEDEIIRSVTITGEADLTRRIEAGEARVFAVLDLESREKEQRITSKAISHFVAHVPDGEGGTRGVFVEARVGDSPGMPVVRFNIERKETP